MVDLYADKRPQEVIMAQKLLNHLADYSKVEQMPANSTDKTIENQMIFNIRELTNVLLDQGDIVTYAEDISDLFLKSFSTLSMQTPILATLLALIYRKKPSFVDLVVNKISKHIASAIETDNIMQLKLLLKTVACLASCNVIACNGDNGLIDVLSTLANLVIVDASKMKPHDCHHNSNVRLEMVYLLSSTVPYCADTLAADQTGSEVLRKVATLLRQVAKNRSSPFDIGGTSAVFHLYSLPTNEDGNPITHLKSLTNIHPFGSDEGSDNVTACCDNVTDAMALALGAIDSAFNGFTGKNSSSYYENSLKYIWGQLNGELYNGSNTGNLMLQITFSNADSIYNLESLFNYNIKSNKFASRDSYNHTITSALNSHRNRWMYPKFSIFNSENISKAEIDAIYDNLNDFDRMVISSFYHDIIYFFDPCLRENGTQMGTIELMINQLNATSKVINNYSNTVKFEYLLVEILFQILLKVPSNDISNSAIYRILLELTKKFPTFPNVVASALSILFTTLPEMDVCALGQLTDWLAFHLNNTQFSWPYWVHWETELKEEEATASPLKTFCVLLVEKLTILNSSEMIEQLLVKNGCTLLASFVPHANIDSRLEALLDSCCSNSGVSVAFVDAVDRRIDDDEIFEMFQAGHFGGDDESSVAKLKLMLAAVMKHGVQNISAVMPSVLNKYADILLMLSDVEKGQRVILETLSALFEGNQTLLNNIVDMMIRKGLLSIEDCGEFVSSQSMLAAYLGTNPFYFKLCELVVDRALDIVRAASSQRSELGGGIDLTQSIDALSNSLNAIKASKNGSGGGDVTVDAEVTIGKRGRDDIENDDNWRSSAIKHECAAPAEGDVEDHLLSATEAVITSLKGCRSLYVCIVGNLVVMLAQKQVDDADTDGWSIAANSLLLRVLRSFHGCEAHYLTSDSGPVMLTDFRAVDIKVKAFKKNHKGKEFNSEKIFKEFCN